MTKILVCGSREFSDKETEIAELNKLIATYNGDVEIVSGHAKGADMFAEEYAIEHDIPLKSFIPDWKQYGRSAGIIRNREMIEYISDSDNCVIAFWDGKSKGTKYTIDTAKKKGLTVIVVQ